MSKTKTTTKKQIVNQKEEFILTETKEQLTQKLKTTMSDLTVLRDDFRTWCGYLPVRILGTDRELQKLITDYERQLTKTIEYLAVKGL